MQAVTSPGYERYRARKIAWLERCGLEQREEWPLFGVRKHIVESTGQVWVYLKSLPALDGHPDGLRRLLGEIRRLEYRLETEGIVGWLQAIRKGNWAMRRAVECIGATLYAEDDQDWLFQKAADLANIPKTVREAIGQYGGAHHGTA